MNDVWPIAVPAAPLAVALLLLGWRARANLDFLVRTPVLDTDADLATFKRLAAADMWTALVTISLGLLAAVAGVTAVLLGRMSDLQALVAGLAVAAVFIPLGLWGRSIERRVQRMPAADHLTAERDEVVRIWNTYPYPTWD